MANVEHVNITDPNIHEPKGAASAPAGYMLVSNGDGTTSWVAQPALSPLIGVVDYSDNATQTTPINVAANTPVYLTNDTLGAFTNRTYLPEGVTDVWDAALNQFDFNELSLGDVVDMRLDVEVVTTSANQDVKIALELGIGGSAYEVPFINTSIKAAGTHPLNRFNSVYMGDSNTLTNGAKFKITSDSAATVKVNGWYCKIIKGR
jgi:hypothetical protein